MRGWRGRAAGLHAFRTQPQPLDCTPAGCASLIPSTPYQSTNPPPHRPHLALPCREEGVLALWRGWLPSVIGVVPYVGLNFGVYETLKDVIIKMYGAYSVLPSMCPSILQA